MGREIKFRAWDEHCKILGEVTFMNDVGSDSWEVDYLGNNGEPKTGLIIEQSTGLRDKYGKEIYEGDIVLVLYTDWPSKTNDFIGSIDEYMDSISKRGSVEYDEVCGCYRILFDRGYGSMYIGEHGQIKVIGNIHEVA